MGDFAVRIQGDLSSIRISCSGVLDIISSQNFTEAVEVSLLQQPQSIDIDLTEVHEVSAAGIKCLVQTAALLQTSDVRAEWSFSPSTRRLLDLVGLWWLGVVEDAVSEQQGLAAALRAYAQLRFSDRWSELEAPPAPA